jgi:hypothetical protein
MAASADMLAPPTQVISEEMIEAIKAAIPKGRRQRSTISYRRASSSDESLHFVGQCLGPMVAT